MAELIEVVKGILTAHSNEIGCIFALVLVVPTITSMLKDFVCGYPEYKGGDQSDDPDVDEDEDEEVKDVLDDAFAYWGNDVE